MHTSAERSTFHLYPHDHFLYLLAMTLLCYLFQCNLTILAFSNQPGHHIDSHKLFIWDPFFIDMSVPSFQVVWSVKVIASGTHINSWRWYVYHSLHAPCPCCPVIYPTASMLSEIPHSVSQCWKKNCPVASRLLRKLSPALSHSVVYGGYLRELLQEHERTLFNSKK